MFNKNTSVFLLVCFTMPVFFGLTCFKGFAAKPTPAPAKKTTTTKAVAATKLEPLSEKACRGIKSYIVGSLNKKASEIRLESKVAFEDTANKTKGTACQLTTQTTGKKFKTIADIAQPLEAILIKQEWKEHTSGAADGSEGKIMRFHKGNNLVILDIKSNLAKEVKCAADVPIDTCYQKAKPEQIKYKIVLTGTRSVQ